MQLDIGSYHSHGPARDCAFIIDLDARPLATLAEDAAWDWRVPICSFIPNGGASIPTVPVRPDCLAAQLVPAAISS